MHILVQYNSALSVGRTWLNWTSESSVFLRKLLERNASSLACSNEVASLGKASHCSRLFYD